MARSSYCPEIQNLFGIEPELTKIDLAVTNSNPVRVFYESIGFKKVNDFSNYLCKKGG